MVMLAGLHKIVVLCAYMLFTSRVRPCSKLKISCKCLCNSVFLLLCVYGGIYLSMRIVFVCVCVCVHTLHMDVCVHLRVCVIVCLCMYQCMRMWHWILSVTLAVTILSLSPCETSEVCPAMKWPLFGESMRHLKWGNVLVQVIFCLSTAVQSNLC